MKIINTLFLLFFVLAGHAQSDLIIRHFSDYEKDATVEQMQVTRKSFELMGELETEDPDMLRVLDALAQLDGVKAIFKEHTDDAHALGRDAIDRVATDEHYQELLSVRTNDETVLMTIREAGDEIRELSLIVGADRCFMVATLYGTIDLKGLSRTMEVLRKNGKAWFNHFENVSEETLVIHTRGGERTAAKPSLDKDLGVQIFPNPATDFIRITSVSGSAENFTLSFYALTGANIGETQKVQLPYELKVEDLPDGVYIVRLTNDDGIFKNYRIVKK